MAKAKQATDHQKKTKIENSRPSNTHRRSKKTAETKEDDCTQKIATEQAISTHRTSTTQAETIQTARTPINRPNNITRKDNPVTGNKEPTQTARAAGHPTADKGETSHHLAGDDLGVGPAAKATTTPKQDRRTPPERTSARNPIQKDTREKTSRKTPAETSAGSTENTTPDPSTTDETLTANDHTDTTATRTYTLRPTTKTMTDGSEELKSIHTKATRKKAANPEHEIKREPPAAERCQTKPETPQNTTDNHKAPAANSVQRYTEPNALPNPLHRASNTTRLPETMPIDAEDHPKLTEARSKDPVAEPRHHRNAKLKPRSRLPRNQEDDTVVSTNRAASRQHRNAEKEAREQAKCATKRPRQSHNAASCTTADVPPTAYAQVPSRTNRHQAVTRRRPTTRKAPIQHTTHPASAPKAPRTEAPQHENIKRQDRNHEGPEQPPAHTAAKTTTHKKKRGVEHFHDPAAPAAATAAYGAPTHPEPAT
ncbi:hypothetical protein SAMN04515648_4501 [Phyllobacterium sp. CL33Tsu]|uniref:hypothetical protein n=1 Tax=Phyllobacterium sp. CL33Tsu TaxID=1798191 RepID=UPI0008F09703|nr:hypothetical protein [Phyllobacterium sp. CL33Tsu]SFJ54158.1 hypothetical protein SAMN04515648_4501 [Phyllobacterium sp. CL33Tsu]